MCETVIRVSLATICHHSYGSIIDCIPYAVHYIPLVYSFHKCKFPMLCITSLWFIYFVNASLYLLILHLCGTTLHPDSLWQPPASKTVRNNMFVVEDPQSMVFLLYQPKLRLSVITLTLCFPKKNTGCFPH